MKITIGQTFFQWSVTMKFVRGLERLARFKVPSAVMWPYQCPVKALLLNKSSIFTTAVWPRLAQPILTSRYSVSLGEYKLNCTIYYFFSYLLAITAVIIFVKNQWTNCPGPTIRTTSVPSRLSSLSSPAKVETENRFYNRHGEGAVTTGLVMASQISDNRLEWKLGSRGIPLALSLSTGYQILDKKAAEIGC